MSEVEKLDRTIKAVKMIVTNLQQKVGELTKTIQQHEEQMQTLMETTSTAPPIPEGLDPERLTALDEQVKAENERVTQMEQKIEAIDQLLLALREGLQTIQQESSGVDPNRLNELDGKFEAITKRLDEIGTPDPSRLEQLETGQNDLDTKLTALRGKLAEVEDTVKVAEPPSVDLNPIQERLTTLETTVQQLETTPTEQIDPGMIQELDRKIVAEAGRLTQIETKFGDLDATLSSLRETMQQIQAAKTSTLDLSKLDALEAGIEQKLTVLRGKLADLEDTIKTIPTASSEAPSFDLSPIQERLSALENQIAQVGSTPPADTTRLDQLEAEIEQKLVVLRGKVADLEDMQKTLPTPAPGTPTPDLGPIQERITALETKLTQVESTPAAPVDTTRLDQLETKFITFRGKLGEIEDSLMQLQATTPKESPSVDLSPLQQRLTTLETAIQKIEAATSAPAPTPTPTPAPAAQPTAVSKPTPSPAAPAETTPAPSPQDIVYTGVPKGMTLKDRVREVISELVTASAITIAGRLEVSTARIHAIIRELEGEGFLKISGDIETGRYEVRLA